MSDLLFDKILMKYFYFNMLYIYGTIFLIWYHFSYLGLMVEIKDEEGVCQIVNKTL